MGYQQDYADAVSRILLHQGAAKARGQLGSGQAWGNLAQQLGELPGQVYGQYQQAKAFGLAEKEHAEDRQQLITDRANKNYQETEALRANQVINRVVSQSLTRGDDGVSRFDESRLMQSLADQGLGASAAGILKTLNESYAASAQLRKLDADFQQSQRQHRSDGLAALGYGVDLAGNTPASFISAAALAKENFGLSDQQLKPYLEAVQKNPTPETVGQVSQQLIALSPTYLERYRQSQTQAAVLPGQQAQSQIQQAVAAGMQGGLTPEQQRQQQQADRTAGFETQRIGLEQQRVGLEAQRVAQTAGDKTDLTPEGLDAAAMMFAKTGQLPALGNADKNTRKAIINRAAVMVPGLDVASAKADFGANQSSLAAMQKQRDAISAFEQTASKNIDIFLETAGKVVDTGSPLINTPARILSGKMLGSANQAQYDAARQVAINEIAKITQGGGLSGVLSDSARKEIGDFNPQNATLKQTVAVLRTLKRDMANRAGSMDEQITAIKARLAKAGGTAAAAVSGPQVGEVRTANGETRRWSGSAWVLVK